MTKGSRPLDPDLATLPTELRAQALRTRARAREVARLRAKEALARLKAAFSESQRSHYRVGKLLEEIEAQGLASTLGHKTVVALAVAELKLSATSVRRLLKAVALVGQEQYAALGAHRVDALLELALATPADDTAQILAGKTIRTHPGGPTLDVAAASTSELQRATAEVRAHVAKEKGQSRRRGRTATPEERERAAAAQTTLVTAGLRCVVRVRATKPGQPSRFDVVDLDLEDLERLAARASQR
jgi:hypothetical protein